MGTIKQRLEYALKHNLRIQLLYKYVLSRFFQLVGLFVQTDDKLILFNSFGGRKFNDSPRVIFEKMLVDKRFETYKFVWAFEEPERFKIPGAESIRIDSWRYFITALKAKIWISSVNIERGLHFKKKQTIYINTWHGAGTKKIGNACSGRKDYDFTSVDMMLVQSEFESDIFMRDFMCSPEAIRKIGFPRNDELFHITEDKKRQIKEKLKIPSNKKVILYAPTWRDSRDGGLSYEFVPPIEIGKWKERLGNQFVMLFRMHTLTTKFVMCYDEFARDVSDYEDLNHLLAISDIVITDYSTIVYDCAITGTPFLCFGFDYESYRDERGFYYDLEKEYPCGVIKNEDKLIDMISKASSEIHQEQYHVFRDKYIESGGFATQMILNELYEKLNSKIIERRKA